MSDSGRLPRAFYRIHEVAEIIGLGKSMTYRLVQGGQIPSVRLAGSRSRRVSATALEDWIAKQEEASGSS